MLGNWLLNMVPHWLWFSSLADRSAAVIRHSPSSVRYTVGFAVAVLGISARELLIPHWTIGVPLVTFYPAVFFAAIIGGLEAGLFATFMLAAAAAYLAFDPVYSFRFSNPADIFTLAVFLALGCATTVLVETLIRARETLAKASRQAQEAEIEAELANQAKDRFLAMVTHELRSPLQAILGSVQVLRNKAKLPAELEPLISVIERNAREEALLVQDLLDVSRISSGKMLLDCEPSSLRTIVESVLESMLPSFEEKHLQVYFRKEGPDRTVSIDPHRIQQVVTNLLTNATKFTNRGGRINVWLDERSDAEIVLSVTDSGIGIDENLKKHLFTPFRQGNTPERHDGLGLGLAIVKRLVELHAGTIEAHSDGKGKGSTFVVRL